VPLVVPRVAWVVVELAHRVRVGGAPHEVLAGTEFGVLSQFRGGGRHPPRVWVGGPGAALDGGSDVAGARVGAEVAQAAAGVQGNALPGRLEVAGGGEVVDLVGDVGLEARPLRVTTVTFPEVAAAGTVARTSVAENTRNRAAARPLNPTPVTLVKLRPRIVT